jgi:peptidoglycan/xylan/chitin deacetylase (PgdA/CDA1 family)
MRWRGLGRMRRAARRLWNVLRKRVVILMYHRVVELPLDSHCLTVTPQHFGEHLEIIRKRYSIIGLRRLVEALEGQRLPRRAVVITFDDGYTDNLYNAKPLLERWDAPATVFVTTGHVGELREFWWDELERLLLTPGTLPEALTLEINGKNQSWELGAAAQYRDEDYEKHRRWSGERELPTRRHQLFCELMEKLRPLPQQQQQHVGDQLAGMTGKKESRPTHRTVSANELVHLADGDLVEIGAHTMTHPSLAAHPAGKQREEIVNSKRRLEEYLGRPVTNFAFPFGTVNDYSQETLEIVREAGLSGNCTTTRGLVQRTSDPFQLPRVAVRDWDGDRFTWHLKDWLDG